MSDQNKTPIVDTVSCVYDIRTGLRVSQPYSRLGDAKRKAKNMQWDGKHPHYVAKICMIVPINEGENK